MMKTRLLTAGTLYAVVVVSLLIGSMPGTVAAQVAQDTFHITFQPKTPAHPWYGMGEANGYALNGVEGKTLRLQRGVTYMFISEHLTYNQGFFLAQDPLYKYEFSGGIQPPDHGYLYDTLSMFFTPSTSQILAHDTIYYGGPNRKYSGGMIILYKTLPSDVEESPRQQNLLSLLNAAAYPNPASSEATVRFDLPERSQVRLELVNALGSVVASADAEYEAGVDRVMRVPLDGVQPGAYFYQLICVADNRVRRTSGQLQVIR